jgi:hypothetical protein
MLPTQVLDSVSDTVERYGLIDRSRPVLVALSGGKDSLLLCLTLRELGIAHHAVTIDMGYEAGWAERIIRRADAIGVTTEIVSARQSVPEQGASPVRRRLTVLDSIDTRRQSSVTPCTYCYSVKVLLLDSAATRLGASQVAFAHHMTDAAASLLKEALLHVDRFSRGNVRYERANFESLVADLAAAAAEYQAAHVPPLLEAIASLVTAGRVGTDEPPRQPLRKDMPYGTEIVRPFFTVDEDTIIGTVARHAILTEGSGCGHGMTLATQTPREMVHHRVLAGRGDTEFFAYVAELVRRGVSENGASTTRARLHRQELLGNQYKPPIDVFDKL